MQLEELDSTKLLVLMGMGAIFALAGLYLLLRPRQTEGETRIELFGLKFNASSAGIVVFLIGAIFLAVPVFVPERVKPPAAGIPTATTPPTTPPGSTAIVLPARADAAELETNNSLHEVNQIDEVLSMRRLSIQKKMTWLTGLLYQQSTLLMQTLKSKSEQLILTTSASGAAS